MKTDVNYPIWNMVLCLPDMSKHNLPPSSMIGNSSY